MNAGADDVPESQEQPNVSAFDSGHFSGFLQRSTLADQPSRRRRRVTTSEKKNHLAPIVLSSRTFAAFWALLVGLHAGHAAFLISCGRLYWYLEHPYLSYYADLVAPADSRHFRFFGTILGVLGGWNAIECLVLLYTSIRARKSAVPSAGILQVGFAFIRRALTAWYQSVRSPSQGQQTVHPSFRMESDDSPRRGKLVALIEQGADLFSIESKRFDTVFTIREVVVVAAQVVQCYSFSSRISRPWINHVSVALVVANCVSVALLYRLLRRYDHFIKRASMRIASFSSPSWRASPAFARLLCHVLDCLLTFSMSVVLPVAVFMPYANQYDAELFTFPLTLTYSDTAFPNMIRENQALFVRSLLDVGYKLVPHMSIYFCLLVIASVLRTRREPPPRTPTVPASAAVRPTALSFMSAGRFSDSRADHDHEPAEAGSQFQPRPSLSRPPPMLSAKAIKTQLRRSAVAIGFMAIAIGILTLHLRATLSNSAGSMVATSGADGSDTSGADVIAIAVNLCAQPVYPWFSSGDSCAVIEFNCYRLGVDTPPTDAFDNLDPSTVSAVIFTHCPALVVPTVIRSFSNLIGLEIYNCTLIEWSAEAALTNNHHPDMIFLIFAFVNMTELPPGVLQTPFPGKLQDIELSKTNLSVLPSSLPDVWGDVELVYLEYSLFTELPRELLSIPALSELSLIGNENAELPDDFSDLIETDDYYFLALASNPIASLPPTLRSGLSFGFLSLEKTDISELPDWVGDSVYEGLYLYDTPLCSSSAAESDSVVSAGCSARDDRGDGRYPLAIMASLRTL